MRTFFVCYRVYYWSGEYNYYTCNVTLNKNEKANKETFDLKFNDCRKEVLSWSLIEE